MAATLVGPSCLFILLWMELVTTIVLVFFSFFSCAPFWNECHDSRPPPTRFQVLKVEEELEFICAGNAATFYFLPIVLLASVVGLASTLVGFHHLRVWRTDSLAAAAAASLIAWLITLLAFGYVPVIFWRPCFFICLWRWSSLMFSLKSLERQTGVDTGHLIPPSLRRSFCSAY